MKTSLNAVIFLASILGFGWLIFERGGRAGDITLGFLIGVVWCVFAGVYIVNRKKGTSGG